MVELKSIRSSSRPIRRCWPVSFDMRQQTCVLHAGSAQLLGYALKGKLRTATLPELVEWSKEHTSVQTVSAETVNVMLGSVQAVSVWAQNKVPGIYQKPAPCRHSVGGPSGRFLPSLIGCTECTRCRRRRLPWLNKVGGLYHLTLVSLGNRLDGFHISSKLSPTDIRYPQIGHAAYLNRPWPPGQADFVRSPGALHEIATHVVS
jgi:hypothetical protein